MPRLSSPSTRTWLTVFLAATCSYALTCSPSVNGGDSGELMNAIATLGIAHPPGYPLYTMLAHLFAKLLPFGGLAFRINLFSGLCNAAAAALLAALVFDITKDRWSGLFTGVLVAFSPLFWQYSVITEVFGLNHLLVSAFLFLYWRQLREWRDGEAAGSLQLQESKKKRRSQPGRPEPAPAKPPARPSRTWMLLCLVAGLGASHHHTSVLITAPLILHLAWLHSKHGGSAWRAIAVAIPCGLVGMLPYAYLLIAARSVPKMAWGNTSDWDGFLTHFLRVEYGTLQLGNEQTGDAGRIFYRLWHFVKALPAQSFLGLGVVTSVLAFRRPLDTTSARFLRASGLTFAFATLFFCHLANLSLSTPLGLEVQSRFWLLPLLFLAIAGGIGARHLPWRHFLVPGVAAMLIAWGFTHENQHGNRRFEDFGVRVLESLPKDSLLFFEGDHTFGALYSAQNILGVRPDIDVLHVNFLSRDWSRRWARANYPRVHLPAKGNGTYGPPGYNLRDLVETNRGPGREVFVLNAIRPWDNSLDEDYRVVPWGLCSWIVPKAVPEDEAARTWIDASEKAFAQLKYPWNEKTRIGQTPGQKWEDVMLNDFLNARHNFGVATLAIAQKSANPGLHALAARSSAANLEAIGGIFPKFYPVYWKNLGLAYHELLPADPTLRPRLIEAWTNYLKMPNNSDPQSPAIAAELQKLASLDTSRGTPKNPSKPKN